MNDRLMFRPDLNDCVLEGRFLLAIANLGTIVPTTSGLVLLTPFPGASSSGAGSLGSSGPSSGSAASVSGSPIPSGFFVTGGGGISSMRPGNLTGIATFAGGPTSVGGSALSIQIGSGADSAQSYGGATTSVVSLTTVADATVQPTLNTIGTVSASSLTGPTLASSLDYHYVAPAPPPPVSSTSIPGPSASAMPNSNTGTGIGNPYAPTMQVGGISSGPFNPGRGLATPLPGSVMPGSSFFPGNN